MRRIAILGMAGLLAVAGVGLTAAPSDAKDWHHNRSGISLGFFFGSPYRYDPYPFYRPYRAYRYPAPRLSYSRAWDAHVAYCYNRYRSYRSWDNTFQPYHGPRRACRSPYIG